MSEIKVVNFSHWSRSGITSLIKTIVKNLDNFEHYYFLLDKDEEFKDFYSEIHRKYQFNYSAGKFSAFVKYIKTLRNINPDIIHVHSLVPLIFCAFFSGKAKIIYHVHCDYPFLTNKGISDFLKRTIIKAVLSFKGTKNISVSESSAGLIRKISGCNCEYVANGIKDFGSIRELFSEAASNGRFYSVSRLDAEKNIIYAIKLIVSAKRLGIDVSYDIYGSGAEKEKIENFIRENSAESFIALKGFIKNPEILPIDYDFYLSTSLQEGLSLSALQALRGRNILVTTPVGQIGFFIKDGVNGYLLDQDLAVDLEKIKKVALLDMDKADSIQVKGRDIFLQQYVEEKFLKKISDLYLDLSSIKFTKHI